MKKKIMALITMCAMVATLTACGGEKKGDPKLVYEFPEGFTEQADGMYYAPDYPNDTSNIYVQVAENDPYGVNYTEDQFVEMVNAAYEAQGYSISNMNMVEFSKGEIEGYDTLTIDCAYELEGIQIEQIEFIIQIGKETHMITYTTAPGMGWTDAFRSSVDSMKVEFE